MSYHFEELHPQQPPEDLQFHASTHTEIVRDAIDATHDAGSSVQLEDWVQCRRPRCLGLPVVRFVPSQDSVGTSLRHLLQEQHSTKGPHTNNLSHISLEHLGPGTSKAPCPHCCSRDSRAKALVTPGRRRRRSNQKGAHTNAYNDSVSVTD